MTNFETLVDNIEHEDIMYIERKSDKQPAKSMRMDGDDAIFFDESAFKTEEERFVALAHEKGHCDSGAFYTFHAPLITKGFCERRAWRRAILEQLPFDKLMEAFEACKTVDGVSVYDLAEHLGVTSDFVNRAINEYICLGKKLT